MGTVGEDDRLSAVGRQHDDGVDGTAVHPLLRFLQGGGTGDLGDVGRAGEASHGLAAQRGERTVHDIDLEPRLVGQACRHYADQDDRTQDQHQDQHSGAGQLQEVFPQQDEEFAHHREALLLKPMSEKRVASRHSPPRVSSQRALAASPVPL